MDKKAVVIVSVLIFLFSFSVSFWVFSRETSSNIVDPLAGDNKSNKNVENTINPGESKTEECPINGEMLTKTQRERWEKRRPLGIMVENHKEARPQSGLTSADVIYEAVAEGGITRFLTIFYCKDASHVGPVRSARVYFLALVRGYGDKPLYAHVGGANTDGPADALGLIEKIGWSRYNDLNQFSVPFPYFWRDYDRLKGRATEHTVYTSTSKLWKYAAEKRNLTNVDSKGVPWDKDFEKWSFMDDPKVSERGDINKVSFGFWNNFSGAYDVSWLYNKENNSYKRINGGKPHLDRNNNKQITAKNVIIVFSQQRSANDGYEGGHLLYTLTGYGNGLAFQNGNVTKITWKKPTVSSRMKFYNTLGKELSIVRGQVFVEILPIGNKVTY